MRLDTTAVKTFQIYGTKVPEIFINNETAVICSITF